MSSPCENCGSDFKVCIDCDLYNGKYLEILDNPKNGKEVLINYCFKHSGEEIYNLLKQIFDESMNWTDSRGAIIEWLENGGMI